MTTDEIAERRNVLGYDVEIDAMRDISTLFAELDEEAQERVMAWLHSRFGVRRGPSESLATASSSSAATSGERERASPQVSRTSFDHPAELFEAARAKTDAEKALVLAYWFQVSQNAASFSSRQVNDELKHLGYGVGNITRALDALMETRPALVIQLEKSGKSKQAQKKFRVTHEGLKRVQQLLSRSLEE